MLERSMATVRKEAWSRLLAVREDSEMRESRNLLVLAGQIGSDVAAQLRDKAERLAASARDVDVDWRDAETLNASCLQVLVALGVLLSVRGRTLRVTADNPDVRRLVDLAGLSACFPRPEPTT